MQLVILLGYAAPYRVCLAFCATLMLLECVIVLLIPWLGGRLAGDVLSNVPNNLGAISLALLALFALQALLKFTNHYLTSWTSERILADLRIRIYARAAASR